MFVFCAGSASWQSLWITGGGGRSSWLGCRRCHGRDVWLSWRIGRRRTRRAAAASLLWFPRWTAGPQASTIVGGKLSPNRPLRSKRCGPRTSRAKSPRRTPSGRPLRRRELVGMPSTRAGTKAHRFPARRMPPAPTSSTSSRDATDAAAGTPRIVAG